MCFTERCLSCSNTKKKKKKQTHIFSGSESVKQSSLQSKSSRLRTWLFLVMVPFGGFPGGNRADSSGLFRCRLCSLISLLTCTSPSSTRDQLWRRWRNRFSHFLQLLLSLKRSVWVGKKKQARQGSNFYPSLSENRYTRVPRQSKRFHACCPSKCILSHPTVPKGVLTICTRWEAEGEGKEEANWQRERKREAERDWMHSPPCFTSPWHLEASPKLLVKTQAGVWWIKQQRQPLPSLPSRLWLWYFSHYQSVCCVCFIHCRVNEYFGPLSTLQRTAVPITHLPPSPSNPAPNLYTTISCPSPLSHSLFSSLLPRLTLTACCVPCLGASLRWMRHLQL